MTDYSTEKIKNPFTSREREFLLSLSGWTKQKNLLKGYERKILYEAGHYNFVFVSRLSKVNIALSELEGHLSSDDAKYATDIRNRGYQIFLRRTAEQGNGASQFYLGDAFLYGLHGFDEDDDSALHWLSKAAEQKHAEALYSLAKCYRHGFGAEVDEGQAIKFYKAALKHGLVDAGYELAKFYLDEEEREPDPKNGLKFLRQTVRNGSADAQVYLGDLYYFGDFVPENNKKALELYQLAADQGSASGWHRLGRLYESGVGVKEDCKKAVEFYTKAAEEGEYFGELDLARCQFEGNGCEQDQEAAFQTFLELVNQDYLGPNFDLAMCYFFGEGAPEDYGRAKFHLDKVEGINPNADYFLGYLKSRALGCDEDHTAAFAHNLKAIEFNEIHLAKTAVGIAFFNGDGVEQDYSEAIKWLLESAEEDDSKAMFYLGLCYWNGYGIKEDEKKGLEMYRSAAERGNESARNELVELGFEVPIEKVPEGNVEYLKRDLLANSRQLYREITKDKSVQVPNDDRDVVVPFDHNRTSQIDALMDKYEEKQDK